MSWLDHAECRDIVPTAAFYEPVPTTDAVAACASCPVRAPCLADELDHRPSVEEVQGYRAGLPAEERRSLMGAAVDAETADSAQQRRVERVRAAVAAGARVADVATAERVSRRTIARWLHGELSSARRLAG